MGCNYDVISSNFQHIFSISDLTFGNLEVIATASVGAIFAMVTWNNITFISAEVKDPYKNIPLALVWGVIIVTVLYLLINLLYVFSIPLEQIQNAPEDIVAVVLMQKITGAVGKLIIALIIMISACGSANGLIMTGARVYYQMAKDKLLFRRLAVINKKTKVPVNSLLLQCFWVSAFILFCGNYSQLLDYVIYAALIFYVLTVIGIFVYRFKYKKEDLHKVNSIFGIFFIIVGLFIIYSLSMYKTLHSMHTFLLISTGVPVYYVWRKIKSINTCTK